MIGAVSRDAAPRVASEWLYDSQALLRQVDSILDELCDDDDGCVDRGGAALRLEQSQGFLEHR